jgi:hypothetical protein
VNLVPKRSSTVDSDGTIGELLCDKVLQCLPDIHLRTQANPNKLDDSGVLRGAGRQCSICDFEIEILGKS